MQMNHDIIKRLKNHPGIAEDAVVGIISSFGKGAEVVTKSDTRDIVVIANTGDIDLDSEVVIPAGADTSYFEKNGHIFADHTYDIPNGAGKLRMLTKYPSDADHKAWKVRAHINDNQIGNDIMTIVRETGQIGVSIGFTAEDYGPPTEQELAKFGQGSKVLRSVVRAWNWFELSFTLLPCNVACQSMGMVEGKSAAMFAAVDELLTKSRIKRTSAAMLGMPITPKRKMFSVEDANGILKDKKVISYHDGLVMAKRV